MSSSRATLRFSYDNNTQTVWIAPFSQGLWEFSCVSFISVKDVNDFPQFLLAMVLQDSASNRRGFWCIEKLGDKYVLEAMHNIPEVLLTAGEFEAICRSLSRQVDKLEGAFQKAAK